MDSKAHEFLPSLPAEWKYLPLTDLISNYVDNRGRSAPLSQSGIPLIATNCIREEGLYPVFEKIRYVSEETYLTWFRAHPKPGDIIIVNKGTPGLVCFVPNPVSFCIAQDMIAIRVNEAIATNKYLFAALRSPFFKSQVLATNVGTTIPHLKKTDFPKLWIPVPPRKEAEIIGETYYQLCEKIELNRQMNATLEQMAQALFKSWFVDFDPVKAKAAGRAPEGMDADTAAFFPSEFEESELGPIPKGWEVLSLGELVDVKHGYAFKSEYFRDEPLGDILLTPGNFEIGGGFKAGKFKYYDGFCPGDFILEEKDLLVTMTDLSKASDTLGYPALVPATLINSRYLHNQRLGKVIINSPERVSKMHLYYLLRSESYRKEILASMTGTTVKHTSPARIKAFRFAFPKDNLSLRFDEYADALYNNQSANNEQSFTLANIRDTLLPRLISGQLRIPEAEAMAAGEL